MNGPARLPGDEWLFAVLVVGIVAKTTQLVPDVYVLRGISQGLCLCVAIVWLFSHSEPRVLARYRLFFVYLCVLGCTALVGSLPVYILFQVVSLLAVVLFSIAMSETRVDPHSLVRIVIICLVPFCVLSLVYLIAWPYEAHTHPVSATHVSGPRFRGIFASPGVLGAVAGMLLGLTLFVGRLGWLLRMGSIVAASACLYLAAARTFWIGAVVALAGTLLVYERGRVPVVATGGVLAAALIAVVYGLGYAGTAPQELAQISRAGSVETLTGRTVLWRLALEKFWSRPFLGYGYSTGDDAFHTERTQALPAVGQWNAERFTMHNGYIQSLLDSGILGAICYTSIILLALVSLLRSDRARSYPAIFYGLLFLSIANFGETLIFTPSDFSSVFFWYFAVFAVGLSHRRGIARQRSRLSLASSPSKDAPVPKRLLLTTHGAESREDAA